MKSPRFVPRVVLGLLTVAFLIAPLTVKAEETPKEKEARMLKKYDANGNGKLDDDELAKMKADEEANKADKRAAAAEEKVDRKSEEHINHAIKKANKSHRVRG